MNRRFLLAGGTALVTGAFFGLGAKAEKGDFPVTKTEAQWREQLSEMQYAVLREEDTERAFTSPLLKVKEKGTYHCAGCDQAVFESETKFDSGTGWPSFFREIEGNVAFKEDNTLFMRRTEEHCSRCGGHFGHVFDDGPKPTGKRHCINGVAMIFRPANGGDAITG
ncbi:peptide-methionine (R)-S-oxide reductase MsrB [Notoacmeibacter sp. MSK16QG-6]|uniref:peptide-methionine (R)-S-oxide reductase MsrB n=1 Tax=Notoacmeibacter sp. MSK16QG-6 TaxID=2957982 RepID=UPI0020A09D16|nr:peptide-methionine (R)-S-oxide reductase MsrB [Notoacmeibacter sp. MSK16QG-6]MCP1198717.1 peptide-methionine (R)-S-oxide reductase MsrB [Notoacmeibacter sp. MSK16QG-6]